MDMNGRFAVITGGAGGIASATATRLSRDGVSGALWDVDRTSAATVASRIEGWMAVECDVTDETSVDAAAAATLELTGGTVDILVNAAGITGADKPLAQYSYAEWRRVIAISLDGTFLCCRALQDALAASDAGRIVNLSSAAAKDGNANLSAYVAAKSGIIGLTKSLAKELAHTEVRVNAITPAVIETPLVDQMTEEYAQSIVARIPLGRMGRPEEVAEMIAFMASPACSYTTGAVFDLSGGRTTH